MLLSCISRAGLEPWAVTDRGVMFIGEISRRISSFEWTYVRGDSKT